MSHFGKMTHAFAKGMRTKTWRCYATSVSICYARSDRLVLASMPSGSKLGGTTPIFSAFWMGLIRCDCPGQPASLPDLTQASEYWREYQHTHKISPEVLEQEKQS